MQKRIGVIALCFIMVLAMTVGCATRDTDVETTDPTTTQATPTDPTTTAEVTEAETPDPFGRMEEPVKLTAMRILTGWMSFAEGESLNDNWWTRTWKEQLNVEVEFTHTADGWGEPLDTMISVAIATDDLPDFLYTYSDNAFKIAKAGQTGDIREAYEKFASPYIRAGMATAGGLPYTASFYDGKMIGIPSNNVFAKGTNMAWIRKDWLDKLDMPVPVTMEDIEAAAAAFRDNAALLGVNDLIPITMHMNLGDTVAALISHYGGHFHHGWYKRNGSIVFASTQPEIKPGLERLHQWYEQGLLAKDFYLKDQHTDEVADISAGRVGVVFGSQHFPNSQGARNSLINNRETEWVFVPLIDANGNPAQQMRRSRITDFTIATRKMDTPEKQEAFIKLINLTAQIFSADAKPEFIVDDQYNRSNCGVDNFWHGSIVVLQWPSDMDASWRVQRRAAEDLAAGVDNSGQEGLFYQTLYRQMNSWVTEGFEGEDFAQNWSIYEIFRVGGSMEYTQNNFEKHAVWDVLWGPETDSMVRYASEWHTKFIEYVILAILTGEVEENYNNWVNYWTEAGGTAALSEVQAWYDANH